MTLLPLLLGHLIAAPQTTTGDVDRVAAVQRLVDLMRRIETVCQPRYLTDPPTPIRAVPDLPIVPGWAKPRKDGGYRVNYGGLIGIVEEESIFTGFSASPRFPLPPNPEGARRWTQAEATVNARAVARLLVPLQFDVGASTPSAPDRPSDTYILTEVVLHEDPRFHIGRIDLPIDPWTGLPTNVQQSTVWPVVSPEHLLRILPEDALVGEAVRVHRSLPSAVPARLYPGRFVYRIPDFRNIPNEMTPAHDASAAKREAIPMYEWTVIGRRPEGPWFRRIWVDARTGCGIAVSDLVTPLVGPAKPVPSLSVPTMSRWRLGKATGTFSASDPATFEGVPIVVTNDRGEVLTLRFDRKTGTVRDGVGTYRPDAALLGAMRKEKPVRAFGRKAQR